MHFDGVQWCSTMTTTLLSGVCESKKECILNKNQVGCKNRPILNQISQCVWEFVDF